MTEKQLREPTPGEYNQQLRSIYDKIAPPEVTLEVSPAISFALFTLTDKALNGEITTPQARHISKADIFTKASQDGVKKQREERLSSPELEHLKDGVMQLLRIHSSLTAPACDVVVLQFIRDFIDGRRLEDPISHSAEVRFSQYMILGMGDPDGEGIFSQDLDKVKEIERTIYGTFMDWVEIGLYHDEEDHLLSWKKAFKKKYGEVPFPNLEPKS